MKDARLTLRLDAALKEALEARASADGRSMSNMAELILREALMPRKGKPK